MTKNLKLLLHRIDTPEDWIDIVEEFLIKEKYNYLKNRSYFYIVPHFVRSNTRIPDCRYYSIMGLVVGRQKYSDSEFGIYASPHNIVLDKKSNKIVILNSKEQQSSNIRKLNQNYNSINLAVEFLKSLGGYSAYISDKLLIPSHSDSNLHQCFDIIYGSTSKGELPNRNHAAHINNFSYIEIPASMNILVCAKDEEIKRMEKCFYDYKALCQKISTQISVFALKYSSIRLKLEKIKSTPNTILRYPSKTLDLKQAYVFIFSY